MLDGVDGGGVHDRLAIGGGHAQVKRGGRAAGGGVGVAARHVHAGLEHAVVDGKACNAFHECSFAGIGAAGARSATVRSAAKLQAARDKLLPLYPSGGKPSRPRAGKGEISAIAAKSEKGELGKQ